MKQTKIKDLNWPKPISGFSCIEMKRQIQEKIYEETKHMTMKELLLHFENLTQSQKEN